MHLIILFSATGKEHGCSFKVRIRSRSRPPIGDPWQHGAERRDRPKPTNIRTNAGYQRGQRRELPVGVLKREIDRHSHSSIIPKWRIFDAQRTFRVFEPVARHGRALFTLILITAAIIRRGGVAATRKATGVSKFLIGWRTPPWVNT